MENSKAIEYRSQLDKLEKELSNVKNKKEREQLEQQIEKLYKEKIFKEFDSDIETKTVENIDEQSILFSEFFGRYLVFLDLSTSQIRNVYGEVLKLKMKGFDKNGLLLLKPHLAYSTERKGTEGSKEFRKIIEKALDKVIFSTEKQEERFQNFANFFEAILAYHRSFGGK